MPVRIDASGDYLRRTTGLLDFQQPYTVMFWYSVASNTAAAIRAFSRSVLAALPTMSSSWMAAGRSRWNVRATVRQP